MKSPSSSPVSSSRNFSPSRFIFNARNISFLNNVWTNCSNHSQSFMRKLRSHSMIYSIVRILIVILLGKILFSFFYSGMLHHGKSQYSTYQNPEIIETKRELLNVDVSRLLRHKSWTYSPITEQTIGQAYEDERLVGYVSNLDLSDVSKKGKEEEQDVRGRTGASQQREVLKTCKDLAYEHSIQHSAEIKTLKDNLYDVRRRLIDDRSFLSREVTRDEENDMSEREIVQKRWYQFGGSLVWLEKEQCYVMFSRVIYSTDNDRARSRLSLVRAQAFDKDWNELKGKRIPYIDVDRPKDIELELHNVGKELGLSDCDILSSDALAYDACIVDNAKNRLQAEKRRERIISKYYMTYPTILEIPFNPDGDQRGPEDPKIILRKTKDFEEPVVVFNLFDTDTERRTMMAYMPHRKVEPLIKFKISGRDQQGVEKNWTPFFHQNLHDSSVSRGFIHFIYTFSPLEILECSLNDGYCDIVFEAETLKITDGNRFGGIRGGTQFIPLPDILPTVKGQQIWIGFPKQHISACGCASDYYRPMFSILVEHDGVYSQELVVPAIGFDMEIISWDLKGTNCKDTNILSPNSIGYWEVVSQNPQTKEYEDYLTLTMSESDINTKVVTLKGMLNFILGIYREKKILNKFEISEKADSIIGQTLKCLVRSAYEGCREYGLSHPNDLDE